MPYIALFIFFVSWPLSASAQNAGWSFLKDKSLVDAREVFWLESSGASSEAYSRPGRSPLRRARLNLGCWKPGGPFVSIHSENLIASYETPMVVRIDQDKPKRMEWYGAIESGKQITLTKTKALELVKRLINSKEAAFRSEARVFGSMEVVFDTTQLADAVGVLIKACSWKINIPPKKTL